ncbi:unnamed protein product [Candida verbasci]|uniref:Zn(2)-C6 fungal-type domain-containing protein n=1 Tax=Candida verbasci TaxID=1227364 RepID=A0A9W4TYD3_9ASCO|nr:unnamed protein product [Candida verbasci]
MSLDIRNRKIKPLHERKRTAAACDRCRSRKTKCEGGFPCSKCLKSSSECIISSRDKPLDPLNYKDQYTKLRKYNCKLERIIQFLYSDITLDFLRNHIDEFEKRVCINEIKPTAVEKPLTNFKKRFISTTDQSFIESISQLTNQESSSKAFSYIHEGFFKQNLLPLITQAIIILPEDHKLRSSVSIYLNICETNYFYMHHNRMYAKVEEIIEQRRINNLDYFLNNWDHLCLVLITIAISSGFEFVQTNEKPPQLEDSPPGIKYYYAALPFVGHLIDLKSIESVQSLLLFGIFSTTNKLENFQLMDGGYLFMSLALEIAIANKLHLKSPNMSLENQEVCKRLWWTVYTMERRHGVNIGKQDIISPKDITVEYPKYVPELNNSLGQNNNLSQISIIELNFIFREITEIQSKYNESYSIEAKVIRNLLEQVEEIKLNFPTYSKIENLDPSSNLYRGNMHLNLTYYLAKIYIGKPFLLYKVENYDEIQNKIDSFESALVDHLSSVCIDAAFCSIELLAELQKNNKLGLFSCSDINFCNISLFTILVYLKMNKTDPTTLLYLKKGLKILSMMSIISSSARSSLKNFKKLNKLVNEITEEEFNTEPMNNQLDSFPIENDAELVLNFDNNFETNYDDDLLFNHNQENFLKDVEELLMSIDDILE